jgi:hypothetical protein
MAYFNCPTCRETVRGPHDCGGETVRNRCGCGKPIGDSSVMCGTCSQKVTSALQRRRR